MVVVLASQYLWDLGRRERKASQCFVKMQMGAIAVPQTETTLEAVAAAQE